MSRIATGRSSHRARNWITSHPVASGIAGLAIALAVSAAANASLARRAERRNPPAGRFLDVNGARLHYVEQGKGPVLVLLHGNGSMVQDFVSSGLFDRAAERYRVIAFDRPGYGHSSRPRGKIWDAEDQADLVQAALAQLGVVRATVLGHSWGCSVAVALARKYPRHVDGLVLASGYYYPSPRVDVIGMSPPAIPIIGDVIRYAISPIVSRLIWPLLTRMIFGPAPVPPKFEGFPKEMAFRPSQIRASAAESALMIPDAFAARGDYATLQMPVAVIAGEDDRLIDIDDQSARLHTEIAQSSLDRVQGVGHMVHQTAPGRVMAAIERVARAARKGSSPRNATLSS